MAEMFNGEILTFKDSHVLESDQEENGEFTTKYRNKDSTLSTRDPPDAKESKKEKDQQNRALFKRTAIKVIKKNIRDEYKIRDYKHMKDNENAINDSTGTNSELTNFNANFIANSDCIFDHDVFYDKLQIQRKMRKIRHIKSGSEDIPSRAISQLPPTHQEDNQNSASNICLSLETEFCKIVDNKTELGNLQVHSSNNSLNAINDAMHSNVSLDQSSDNEVKAEAIEKNSIKKENTVITGDKILHEEPLDFGISSTLAYLKSRNGSSLSKPDRMLTNQDHTQNNLDNLEQNPSKISILHTDNNGNILNPKDAFKRLCWKFHGQKINKNKLERMFRNHLRNLTNYH